MTKGRKLQYGYDNNGNQTTRIVPTATDKSWTQTWDYENRLTTMEKTKGPDKRTVSFSYDPLGRRIGKQVTTIIDGVTKTQTYAYVYDNDDILLETFTVENNQTTTTWYTHGAGIDEHLALERNGSYYYYHADGLGSIVAITDAARNVVQSYEYDSYGMVTPSTSFRNSYTYTGREWDKETGLDYYRARYYDPIEGRFVSKDPIGLAGGVNVYAYTSNNPINFIDPLGLKTTIITTYDTSYGITYGSHSALFISRPGQPSFLYDPAGSYNPKGERGTGGTFEGNDANLQDYIKYQRATGSTVKTIDIPTTKEQENAIIDRAIEIGDPRGFGCASSVSAAMGGVCNVTDTRFPGNLYDKAKGAKCGKK
jgi:RHS repeat-associated protein